MPQTTTSFSHFPQNMTYLPPFFFLCMVKRGFERINRICVLSDM